MGPATALPPPHRGSLFLGGIILGVTTAITQSFYDLPDGAFEGGMGRGELHLGEGNYFSPLFRITDPFTSSIGSVVPPPVAMTTLRAGPLRFTSPPPFPTQASSPGKADFGTSFLFFLPSKRRHHCGKKEGAPTQHAHLSRLAHRLPLGVYGISRQSEVRRGGSPRRRDSRTGLVSGGGIQAGYGCRGPSWLLSGRGGEAAL